MTSRTKESHDRTKKMNYVKDKATQKTKKKTAQKFCISQTHVKRNVLPCADAFFNLCTANIFRHFSDNLHSINSFAKLLHYRHSYVKNCCYAKLSANICFKEIFPLINNYITPTTQS